MIVNNATLVTFWSDQPVVEGALIAIEGKTIVDFGRVGKLVDRYDDSEILDASGRLVLPGLVNAHVRLGRRLAMGLRASGREPREHVMRRFDSALDPTTLYWSVLVELLDAVRAGVTTLFSLHSSPACVGSSLDAVASAFHEVGLRGCLAYAVSAHSDPAKAVHENERFMEAIARDDPEFVQAQMGVEASTELGESELESVARAAGEHGAPCHVVVDGGRTELDYCLSRFGVTPVGRLSRAGLLSRGGILVRGGDLPQEDERSLSASDVFLVHCPQSNISAAVGSPDLRRLSLQRVKLALGTDAHGPGIADECRIAAFLQRAMGRDNEEAMGLALQAAIAGNADLATRRFGPPLGRVKPGARADLIVMDYRPSTPLSEVNFTEQVFWGALRAPVHSVIVNGKLLYQNGSFVHLDEGRLRARSREVARRLWERMGA